MQVSLGHTLRRSTPALARAVWQLAAVLTVAGHLVAGGPLTTARSVRDLTREEAVRKLPVIVRGVLTLNVPDRYLTFFQDDTAGIYVNGAHEIAKDIPTGTAVEVRGYTGPGLFAPVIEIQQITSLGPGHLPKPATLRLADLQTGALDSQYVAVSGVVRSFKYGPRVQGSSKTAVRLFLLAPTGRFTVEVLQATGFDPEHLIGSTLVAQGPVVVTTNKSGQLIEQYVATRSAQELQVIGAEQVNPYGTPVVPIASLMQFRSGRMLQHRVRVRGIVTFVDAGHRVVIQEGSRGLVVDTDEELDTPLGTEIDAVGFLSAGTYSPVLADARIRMSSQFPPTRPDNIEAEAAASGKYEARLIRVRAEVVAHFHDGEHQVIRLQSGSRTFAALLDSQGPHNAIDNWEQGTTVDLTGICRTTFSEDLKEPDGFSLWLRSTDDARVVREAPWWTGTRMMEVVGGATLLILIVAAWNLILSRRVRRQTAQIQNGAQFERERGELLEMVGRNETLESIFHKLQASVERQIGVRHCTVYLNHPEAEQRPPSVMSVPIMSSTHTTLGTLDLPSEPDLVLHAADREFLENIARLAGIAIEHRQLYDRLTRLSQEDALTGLPNRLVLEDRLRQAIGQAARYYHQVACMYVDLDGFKQINDTLGHRVGDLVLRAIADRIRSVVRESDTTSRLGGDEFCLVLPKVDDMEEARALAERLLESIRKPIVVDDHVVGLSSSIGISFFPVDGLDILTLQRNADAAMYRAKNAGKNRVCVFSTEPVADTPPVLR